MNPTRQRSSEKFIKFALQHIRVVRNDILDKLSKNASEQITKHSTGQMAPKTTMSTYGFEIGVPVTREDPQGIQMLKVEQSTGAFKKTFAQLNDKTYVKSVLERK